MDKPTKCPKCGDSPLWRKLVKEGAESKTYSVECKGCGYRWKETYATYLARIEPDNNQIRTCPNCGHVNNRVVRLVQLADDTVRIQFECPSCRTAWADNYRIELLESDTK